MQRPPVPTEVRKLADARVVRVTWSDGHRSDYTWAYLRGWCPCAACQGHTSDRRYVEGGNDDLKTISVVGSYALGITWGDGHSTGIYSYRYLRDLCPCEACAHGQ